jgi:hypothetical protein
MNPGRPLAFLFVGIMAGCADALGPVPTQRKPFDDHTAGVLAGATKVEVFRIDGGGPGSDSRRVGPGDRRVDGFPITGRAEDQGPEFAAKLNDILSDPKTYSTTYVACFYPRVVFRVWKGEESVDVVICFACHNVYIGPPSDKRVGENASFYRSDNAARLIQLAEDALPHDTKN